MASQLIDAMAGTWDPKDYHDTYTDKVKKLIKDKEKGQEVVTEEKPPTATNVTDLMEMLRRSVEESRGGRPAATRTKAPATKRLPGSARTKKARATAGSRQSASKPRKATSRKAS